MTYDIYDWDTMYGSSLLGQRLYYMEATPVTNKITGDTGFTLFGMRNVITRQMLHSATQTQKPAKNKLTGPFDIGYDKSPVRDIYAPNNNMMDTFVTYFNDVSAAINGQRLSSIIFNQWPASPFEEWCEDNITNFWMTAQYYEDRSRSYDYALLVNVHCAITGDTQDFLDGYGESMTMTKMMYG